MSPIRRFVLGERERDLGVLESGAVVKLSDTPDGLERILASQDVGAEITTWGDPEYNVLDPKRELLTPGNSLVDGNVLFVII
ncbi:MAG TPA: hypothetical protein VMW29_01490 [Candidatus Bathyarchaeia archaeon]|nr:hypothetical protein [Candidatus Bathyarchaeia archaeon]